MNPANDLLLCGFLNEIFAFDPFQVRRTPKAIYHLIYSFVVPLSVQAMILLDADHENTLQIYWDAEFDYEEDIERLNRELKESKETVGNLEIECQKMTDKLQNAEPNIEEMKQRYELKIKSLEQLLKQSDVH